MGNALLNFADDNGFNVNNNSMTPDISVNIELQCGIERMSWNTTINIKDQWSAYQDMCLIINESEIINRLGRASFSDNFTKFVYKNKTLRFDYSGFHIYITCI